jgi:hypothetical protein
MGLPKKIKKNIPLTQSKILLERRQELVDKINKDGTFLPKSILHADLDGGFLDFVKNDLKTIVSGKVIPNVDILLTTQNWAQFTQTWDFQNIDKNVEPPIITVIRNPEVKYGTNPSTLYTIPNRRQYFYAQVPTWDGQRSGVDIYKIPQPVPVDITYSVKIICNRMRELNQFNKIVLEKFSSRQAYAQIKGHYIPIIMNNISDESVMDVEKRKYYIQSYEFTMLGFLIDEDEFEVSPAITRLLQVVEFDTSSRKKSQRINSEDPKTELNVLFLTGVTSLSQKFYYTTNISVLSLNNIDTYDIFINGEFYGSEVSEIQINNGDTLKIDIVKLDDNFESNLTLKSEII